VDEAQGQGRVNTRWAMAKAIGRSAPTLNRYFDREDWPEGIPRQPPWTVEHVERLKEWAGKLRPDRNHLPLGSTGVRRSKSEKEVDLEIKQERARKLKLTNDALNRKLVDREKVERRIVQAIHAIKSELAATANALPGELRNHDPALWHTLIQSRFDAMCERFANNAGARP
jgi:hypothetical protein